MKAEIRAIGTDGFSFTTDAEGVPCIQARAIVFDSWSRDFAGFRERCRPGSISLDPDLVALWEHDPKSVLGSARAGTMRSAISSEGVDFVAYPPATTWAADLRVSMDRGDIRGCSFKMFVSDDLWYVDLDGAVCRDVLAAVVPELTVSSMPAYLDSLAEARNIVDQLKLNPELRISSKGAIVKPEIRIGRVMSSENEQILKNASLALEAAADQIEKANEAVEGVLAAVDPSFVDPDAADDSAETSEDLGGSPDELRNTTGGAPVQPSSTFVAGFGFIPNKGK